MIDGTYKTRRVTSLVFRYLESEVLTTRLVASGIVGLKYIVDGVLIAGDELQISQVFFISESCPCSRESVSSAEVDDAKLCLEAVYNHWVTDGRELVRKVDEFGLLVANYHSHTLLCSYEQLEADILLLKSCLRW